MKRAPKDWATYDAIKLVADLERMPFNDRVEVLASLLRTVSPPPQAIPSDAPAVLRAPEPEAPLPALRGTLPTQEAAA